MWYDVCVWMYGLNDKIGLNFREFYSLKSLLSSLRLMF